MAGVLSRAFKLIFDFKRDVSDLADELKLAEKDKLRLVREATELQGEIERLRRENNDLNMRNEELQKALGARE